MAAELPDDLDQAFDALRLVMLRYKLGGFRDCDPVILHGRVDFLRELLSLRVMPGGGIHTRLAFPDQRKHPEE